MSRESKIRIAIAELSPVISSGFSHCLRTLPALSIDVSEIKSSKELLNYVRRESADILLVSPHFGGVFDPTPIREESKNDSIKIVAIETGKLNRQTASLFDDTLSVTDDIDTIVSKIKKLKSDKTEINEAKEPLSSREKEIISLVVKGLTNQEIADRLFLSIHTVITHRRNIAKKLEIHSATGLTIYAIVNKIVDISDIKL